MARLPGEDTLDHQILRQEGDDWVLVASRCPQCGDTRFPPRELCAMCLTRCRTLSLSREGAIYEAVKVQIAPVGFEPPYWTAYVDFDEGIRVFAPLRWPHKRLPSHDEKVRYSVEIVRREPYEVVGPVFAPIE